MTFKHLVTLTVTLTLFSVLDMSLANNSEPCEYDLDLTKNTVKISCQGTPSVVNVYAEKALLQADENIKNNLQGGYGRPITGGGESQNMETASSGSHPEKQTPPRPGSQSTGDPITFQKDRVETAFKNAGSFTDVVWKALLKLEKAKQSLSTYADSSKSISFQMSEGDLLLKTDMEKLRRTSNSATDLKSGIIAAMTNQYNFMRSALLARNYELEKLVSSLTVLVDVTADGLQSALTAHRMTMDEVAHINVTLLAIRKMVSRELMKRDKEVKETKGNKYDQCPKEISAIGAGTYKTVNWQKGSYMVQSLNPSEFRSVFILEGTGTADQLFEYHAPVDVEPDLVGGYILIPFTCAGTGHVVYRRHFYCHKMGTDTIVKYHLKKRDIVHGLRLPGVKYGNTAPYSSGENTDVDLSVDEYGLWAVYATKESGGKMVISKIDHKKMTIEHTWLTSYPKMQVGNAFMICGVLYAINSHKDAPTFIRYIFNTETNTEQTLEKGELPFSNSALLGDGTAKNIEDKMSNTVMLSYDYRTSSLYSWNKGRIETFPVFFKIKK